MKNYSVPSLFPSEERYRTTFQGIPDPITTTRTEDGRFLYVNDEFCRTFGLSREETLGKTVLELGLMLNPEERSSTSTRTPRMPCLKRVGSWRSAWKTLTSRKKRPPTQRPPHRLHLTYDV